MNNNSTDGKTNMPANGSAEYNWATLVKLADDFTDEELASFRKFDADEDRPAAPAVFAPSTARLEQDLRSIEGITVTVHERGLEASPCPACRKYDTTLEVDHVVDHCEVRCDACLDPAGTLGWTQNHLEDMPFVEPIVEPSADEIRAAARQKKLDAKIEEEELRLEARDIAKERHEAKKLAALGADEDPDFLDLADLRGKPLPPVVWLEERLIRQGQITKITAESGAGKSLIAANLALSWSLGYSLLDRDENGAHRELERPLRVLYIDGELGPEWWHEYLEKFDAPMETPNLMVRCFPKWGPLTELSGAAQFWKLVDKVEPDMIIMDTLSSFIDGEENSADTWIKFDNNITKTLKDRKISAVVLDHTGKNVELGARGSSAKKSNMDAEWVLSEPKKNSDRLLLTNAKKRTGKLPEKVAISRLDTPLRHERTDESLPTTVQPTDMELLKLISAMDAAGVPTDIGRPTVQKKHGATIKGFSNDMISAAIKHRKEREAQKKFAAGESEQDHGWPGCEG